MKTSPGEHDALLQTVTKYYDSLESKLGYRLMLGRRRHFGYWAKMPWWPFGFQKAMERMEKKAVEDLALPPGALVLDAGCGSGFVARTMATYGALRVTAIDINNRHLASARQTVARAGPAVASRISIQNMDYHHLDGLADGSHDGVLTMETFCHASDQAAVLTEFCRVLRPGGRLAIYDYGLNPDSNNDATAAAAAETTSARGEGDAAAAVAAAVAAAARRDKKKEKKLRWIRHTVTKVIGAPSLLTLTADQWKALVAEAGFENVRVECLNDNLRPMALGFFIVAAVPYCFIKLLHLDRHFVNTIAAVNMAKLRNDINYFVITASKPEGAAVEPAAAS